MSSVKMTDILVQTSAFIVTLTYPKSKSFSASAEAVLEITPIIQSATKDMGLADKFFTIITSDLQWRNKRTKDAAFQAFIKGCTKKILEEFWDNSNWGTLEKLSVEIPTVTCLLYDQAGSLVHLKTCSALSVMRALYRIEEALFISAKTVPSTNVHAEKAEWKRDQNRETRKYMMHHRLR